MTRGDAIERLAVLAFEVDQPSSDDRARAVALGLAEELCFALSGTPGLRLTPSEAAFRHPATDAAGQREAGRRLGADIVVGGRLSLQGEQLRVDARLVHTGRPIEATTTVEGRVDALIDLLETLLGFIGDELRAPIPDGALQASLEITDSAALLAVFEGRLGYRKHTGPSLEHAAARYRDAITRVPDYLSAHLGLFEALTRLRLFWEKGDADLDASIDETLNRLRALDPDGVRVNWYAVLPESADLTFWDVAGREARAREAVLRNRTSGVAEISARHRYADLLSESGLVDGALAYLELCEAEEPPHAHRYSLMGQLHGIRGALGLAETWLRRSIELDPTLVVVRTHLIVVLHRSGQHDAAAAELDRVARDLGEDLTGALRAHGHYFRGEAAALASVVADVDASPIVPPFFKGMCLLMAGDVDAGIARFEVGHREEDRFVRQLREKGPFYLGREVWDELSTGASFRTLLRTLGLDDRWRAEHLRRANLLAPITGIALTD